MKTLIVLLAVAVGSYVAFGVYDRVQAHKREVREHNKQVHKNLDDCEAQDPMNTQWHQSCQKTWLPELQVE